MTKKINYAALVPIEHCALDPYPPRWESPTQCELAELFGTTEPAKKRRTAAKFQQQIECIQLLPNAQRRLVMKMLGTVLTQAVR